jgi:hypothetical protein
VPRPAAGRVPAKSPAPVLRKVPEKRRFNFSFRFFKQSRYFGLGACEGAWFVSLLEKLAELSGKYFEDIMKNSAEKDTWRFHPLNWSQLYMPIKRTDLDWVDRKYLDNEDDYDFLQFQLTTSLGRIIGFWDDTNPPIFNIVLLDPLHNAQPTKRFDYRVRETTVAKGEFSAAINLLEIAIKECGADCHCRAIFGKLQSSLTRSIPYETMLIPMDKHLYDTVTYHIESGLISSATELLEIALHGLGD